MNRRSFLGCLAGLPFLGWLNGEPKPREVEVPFVVDPRLTSSTAWYGVKDTHQLKRHDIYFDKAPYRELNCGSIRYMTMDRIELLNWEADA